jgi:hypothetical protein
MAKQAGTERPYTVREFVRKIEQMAHEQRVPYLDQLDYISSLNGDREITNPYADLTMRVAYGSCEGIYADVMLRTEGKEQELFTAKTLGESQMDFVAISTMAAHLCCIGKKYIADHDDEFRWEGHEVTIYDGDRACGGYALVPEGDIDEVAMRGVKEGYRVVIRNNITRKEWEYKPKNK